MPPLQGSFMNLVSADLEHYVGLFENEDPTKLHAGLMSVATESNVAKTKPSRNKRKTSTRTVFPLKRNSKRKPSLSSLGPALWVK